MNTDRLEVSRASELTLEASPSAWLIEHLWAERAVGIVGGEPKSGKSFLALHIAVSVASGAPCLGRFTVPHKGRVLLFAAEDGLAVVRNRLEGIALTQDLRLDSLDLYVITSPSLRLDIERDRRRLLGTLSEIRPRLLVLDPFVRLHRCDENLAQEVVPLLAYLRDLERTFETAILLVHHVRKGARALRAGQALRGSSELHAWGDSNLYLRRRGDELRLSAEHRAARAPEDILLKLPSEHTALALEIIDCESQKPATVASPAGRVRDALAVASAPLSLNQLRAASRMRTSTLCETLNTLLAEGTIRKTKDGYTLLA